MTKTPPCDTGIKAQAKELILETIKKQKPQTTQQLIKLVQEKIALSEGELIQIVLQLEKEDNLHFTKEETFTAQTYKEYALSKKANWYWTTIVIAIVTTITVLIIPNNAYPLTYLRSLLGTAFIFILPGYAFLKLLFPSKVPIHAHTESLDTIERAIFAVGTSIALVSITNLILNSLQLNTGAAPITLNLLALTAIFATVAMFREYQAKVTISKVRLTTELKIC
jgi:uncharacterized membrane protein